MGKGQGHESAAASQGHQSLKGDTVIRVGAVGCQRAPQSVEGGQQGR